MLERILLTSVICLMAVVSSAQINLNLLGQYQYPGSRGDCSDIWGYVDGSGNEYAIVGNQTGTSIVDVTDPANPNEVFFSPGPTTIWRDMKVWGDAAYITNENNGGLKIIDLSNLPGPITAGDVYQYTGSSYPFSSAHNIFIDEVGHAYILGADNGAGGAIILDVDTNPLSPIELGRYNDFYLHDAFVRNDTLWGGAVYDGFFTVVDVTNPASCVTMATHFTPTNFSHNVWLSDDGNTLFTTDEVSNAYVASFDVSDIMNISELDRVQSSPGQNVIPHNTFVKGNFLVTSYYRDGIVIHDATNPANLIEVGNYDTSPAFSGDGFNGAWGVYPYLPSGNILASDQENGLFILGPNYVQAAYLEGNITDAVTTNPINNAQVEIVSSPQLDFSNTVGDYASGMSVAGTYDVTYSKLGYISQTINGVTLTSGSTTIVDVQLQPQTTFNLQGLVEDQSGNPISNAQVMITDGQFSSTVTTNGLGEFQMSSFLEGTYDVNIGLWGYYTLCLEGVLITASGGPYVYQLEDGYSDNFELDLGWSVSGNPDSGDWERDIPVGTTFNSGFSNPDADSQDCGDFAYITGNGGGQAGTDDVDNGITILTSPTFDLSTYVDPYLSFDRWFFNEGGAGTPDDTLTIEISNGTQAAYIDVANQNDPDEGTWVNKSFRINDFVNPTAFMQIKIRAMDVNGGHLVEGGFDNFYVWDSTATNSITDISKDVDVKIYPNPFTEELSIEFENIPTNASVEIVELSSGRIVDQIDNIESSTTSYSGDLESGVYMIRIAQNNEIILMKKVVKL